MTSNDSQLIKGNGIKSQYIVITVGVSVGGLILHNLTEFPLSILVAPETLIPVGVTLVLGIAMLRWPSRNIFLVTAGWGVIVFVFGGGSVLPLPIWPFTPEQTAVHYSAHIVYALSQIPLIWVALRGIYK